MILINFKKLDVNIIYHPCLLIIIETNKNIFRNLIKIPIAENRVFENLLALTQNTQILKRLEWGHFLILTSIFRIDCVSYVILN